ncbi:MAG: group 1 truncated hemoglobin [Planctomycetota bacterium]
MNHSPTLLPVLSICVFLFGCAAEPNAERQFHTSGDREADQRAEQRIAKVQQDRGEMAADGGVLQPLFQRLGGEKGVAAIVSDFVDRARADPRVNWDRKGVVSGGMLGIGGTRREWHPTAEQLELLKQHLVEFIAVATGGPSTYSGRNLKAVHAGMLVDNTEFDATMGALKATMDALQVGIAEQKELLAIMESTRPQIAEKR